MKINPKLLPTSKILKKVLNSTTSGTGTANWQNIGSMYLDLEKGTWLVVAQYCVKITGNGTPNIRLCLSNTTSPSGYNKYAMSRHYNSDYTFHQLSAIIELEDTTRVYMLEEYAYSGSNWSIQLLYNSSDTYDGVQPYIMAIKLQ